MCSKWENFGIRKQSSNTPLAGTHTQLFQFILCTEPSPTSATPTPICSFHLQIVTMVQSAALQPKQEFWRTITKMPKKRSPSTHAPKVHYYLMDTRRMQFYNTHTFIQFLLASFRCFTFHFRPKSKCITHPKRNPMCGDRNSYSQGCVAIRTANHIVSRSVNRSDHDDPAAGSRRKW